MNRTADSKTFDQFSVQNAKKVTQCRVLLTMCCPFHINKLAFCFLLPLAVLTYALKNNMQCIRKYCDTDYFLINKASVLHFEHHIGMFGYRGIVSHNNDTSVIIMYKL